jgi:sec-independent protein translocase protein TatC
MDKVLTFGEHLSELRKRIIIIVAALALTTALSFPFASYFLKILKIPAAGLFEKLAFFSPQEAFLIYMRISFLAGLVISMPVILYQLWAFVSPALEERFKRRVTSFIFFSFFAFILGAFFAYFVVIPPALKFLLSFAKDEFWPVIAASKYVSFMVSLIFGCGAIFQMPVVSFILTKVGIVDRNLLRKKYKYAVVVICIVAAVITPTTDIFNMLLLALPMLLLYEVSILVSGFAKAP